MDSTKSYVNGNPSEEPTSVDFEAIRRRLEKEAAKLKAEITLHLEKVPSDFDREVVESSFLETKKSTTKSTSTITTYFTEHDDKEVPAHSNGHATKTYKGHFTPTTRRPGILKSSKNGNAEFAHGHNNPEGEKSSRRNSIRYCFDLGPGLRPEDLTVQIVDDKLRVCTTPHPKTQICRKGDCFREVALPAVVDPASATAVLSEEGFLTVDLYTS